MLAFCFVIVYFSVPIILTVQTAGGFNLASVKISLFYFKLKNFHRSLLSPSNIKAIVRYQLNVLIKAFNPPEIITALLLNMLIPPFWLSEIRSCKILTGNNYSLCRSASGRNINPSLVYTMRSNCNTVITPKRTNWSRSI